MQRDQRRELTLTTEGADLARRLGDLEAATGAGAVSGPGMVLRIDDAAATGDAGDGADVDPRTDEAPTAGSPTATCRPS